MARALGKLLNNTPPFHGLYVAKFLPNVYSGTSLTSRNLVKLHELGITHILNTASEIDSFAPAKEKDFSDKNDFIRLQPVYTRKLKNELFERGNVTTKQGNETKEIQILKLNIHDYGTSNPRMLEFLDLGINFINEGIKEGSVLVHCQGAKNRSIMMVMAFLISSQNYTYDDALAKVTQVRPSALFAKENNEFLKEFETKVRKYSFS